MLQNFLDEFIEVIKDALVWMVNKFIEFIALLIDAAAAVLPEWEVINVEALNDTYGVINALNWLFPVSFAIQMIGVFVASTLAYFTIGTLTRWAKITGG
jgi:hypothetical protein